MESRTRWIIAAGVVLGLAGPALAEAQAPLADVARREAARRQTVEASGKVYTNESLRGGRPASAPQLAPPVAPAGSASATPVPPEAEARPDRATGADAPEPGTPVPPGERGDETSWRKRVTDIREQLSRTQLFEQALQTRVNALDADFTARDDPAQRAVIETDRNKAVAEMERVRKEIQDYQKALVALQDEARRAGVPPGWLR